MDNSPFGKLPAEVRNTIWQLTLAPSGQIRIKSPRSKRRIEGYTQPPISLVCRQMRDECLLMFYALNNFIIEIKARGDWSDSNSETSEQLRRAMKWVMRMKPEYHKLIGRIGLEIFTEFDKGARPGGFRVGAKWRENHRWWEHLVDMLVCSGYEPAKINVCAFVPRDWGNGTSDGTWFWSAFREMGVRGVIETDMRMH